MPCLNLLLKIIVDFVKLVTLVKFVGFFGTTCYCVCAPPQNNRYFVLFLRGVNLKDSFSTAVTEKPYDFISP